MPQKVCPRCGSLFASLKSATCPQCFARLETLDDDTAAELSAVRSKIESTREFQEQKDRDDERFRHESFRACLAVVGMGIAVAVFSIVIIAVAIHRRPHGKHAVRTVPPASATLDLLTDRPAENASIEDVMPQAIGTFHLTTRDQRTTLSGTLTQVYHAQYADGPKVVDLYAVSGTRPATELSAFRDAVSMIAGLGAGQPRPSIQFRTVHWHYGAIGLNAGEPDLIRLRTSLGALFSQS